MLDIGSFRGRAACACRDGRRLAVVLIAAGALLAPPAMAGHEPIGDLDKRSGSVQPTASQRATVRDMEASARWNDFGTPRSLIRHDGVLATGVAGTGADEAARSWLTANAELFRLGSSGTLETLAESRLGDSGGWVVTLTQRFGDLRSVHDGLVTVGLRRVGGSWDVIYASSTLTGDRSMAAEPTVGAREAWLAAARDVGRNVSASDVTSVESDDAWRVLAVDGFSEPQRARLVALPTPEDGVRPAWETFVVDNQAGHATGFAHFVDAATGDVIVRRNIAHQSHDAGEDAAPTPAETQAGLPYPPKWQVFPAYPLLDGSQDIREIWCWQSQVGGKDIAGCEREVMNPASRAPWDWNVRTGAPTFTTSGNNAHSAEAWTSPLTPGATAFRPISPRREYSFAWKDAWRTSGCSTPFVPGESHDIAAATTNLFAMHNRIHDWAYALGFTERHWNAQDSNFGTGGTADGDALLGDAQAGAMTGGFPSYRGRDNANMITLPDGVHPITNMYLWQPIAGAFYSPCVDGDFDMAVIGHEYGHLIENRMIGKGNRRSGHHAGAMGESSGDLIGVEYLNEDGIAPVFGENPFALGAYVTGNGQRGIRNYGMNASPLNFSDIGYDLTGAQVHADGEIWSATNYDLRQALVDKYESQFPEGDEALQRACAAGEKPADQCPGNRRWIQIMFDAYLLMPPAPSMLDARDAYLAADRMRFGGANQAELWGAFARRGFGGGAWSTNGAAESGTDPRPDFASPHERNSDVEFKVVTGKGVEEEPVRAQVFVGDFEARVSPVADTDPASSAEAKDGAIDNLDHSAQFAPGTYQFVVRADGYGHVRVEETVDKPRETIEVTMHRNHASKASGATASGDGTQLDALIDDTEATNWDRSGAPVEGSQVTVDLAGDTPVPVRRVNVSAMLLDQNRFTALRQFAIEASTDGATFERIYTSPADAFPGARPRPVSPELILRSFEVPRTEATHVRLVVLSNQCTGNPVFQGSQDKDPLNGTDCREGSPGKEPVAIFGDLPQVVTPRDTEVHVAELQVFSQ